MFDRNVNIKVFHFQLLILVFCFLAGLPVKAQQTDTTHRAKADTVKKHTVATHSPAKATLYSALLPGLGQAYNHKYWKIPIIYAGLGTMAYFIVFNQQHYNTYESALKTRSGGGIDPYINVYSSSDLVTIRDYYHRNRDLSVIGAAVFYVLNIIDADVDAQMFTFNVSDDLSMRLSPAMSPYLYCGNVSAAPSLSLVINMK